MINIITCTQCHKSGLFDLEVSFTYDVQNCDSCQHIYTQKWKYWFCNLACLASWWGGNDIDVCGFPCRACLDQGGEPSGFAFGFESNGACDVCHGLKRVLRLGE
jgi:hypothetical protein